MRCATASSIFTSSFVFRTRADLKHEMCVASSSGNLSVLRAPDGVSAATRVEATAQPPHPATRHRHQHHRHRRLRHRHRHTTIRNRRGMQHLVSYFGCSSNQVDAVPAAAARYWRQPSDDKTVSVRREVSGYGTVQLPGRRRRTPDRRRSRARRKQLGKLIEPSSDGRQGTVSR